MAMAAAPQEYSVEQLNYLRVCKVTTEDIADGLRKIFKQEWDKRYQATLGQWQDTAKNGIDLYSLESAKSRKRNSRELAILRNGNSLEWDCSTLFFAILYSDIIGRGKGLDPTVRKEVDNLRQFRNKVFAHVSEGKLSEAHFQTSMQSVIDAFSALKLDTAGIEAVKNEKTFSTKELRVTQQQLEEEKKRNEEPRSFCVLPPKASHEVLDRTDKVNEVLDEMKRLRSTKRNEITVVYLSGNPGCGKSELSRQIGQKVFDEAPTSATDQVNMVFALNASSTDALVQSYVELAISLNCDENSATNTKDLSQEDKLNHLKSLVVPKLRKYSSWLLIVDNVTDVKSVFKYLPQVGEKIDGNGQILVTTQDSRSIGPSDSYSFHLSLSRGMTPDKATRALSEVSGIVSDKCTSRVAKALDFQPLALACAATYMKRVRLINSSMSWEDYLKKLEQGKREATEGEYKRISVTYSRPMTAAVRIALEKEMAAEDMVMMHAFQFLSVMAPQPIPLEYVVKYVTQCLPNEEENLVAATIMSSSLILRSEDLSKEVGVHQVVYSCLQCIVGHKHKETEFYFFLQVINAFSALLDDFDEDNVNHIITTRSMIVHFVSLSENLNCYTPKVLSPILLNNEEECKQSLGCIGALVRICYTHGKHGAAETFVNTELMTKNMFYPDNHPSIASTLNNLGLCLDDQGKHKEAQKYYERALAIKEKAYDPNHPSLSVTLSNLGLCLDHQGKYKEAQKYHERALAIQEKAYDPNHPSLSVTLSNLGLCLDHQGKHKEAQKYYERALAIKEKAYDPNHPSLAITLSNLGNCLDHQRKHKEAQKYHKRALAIQEKANDPNHPSLAVTLSNLGNCLNDQGKYKEALKCHERALAIQEKAYDPNHPSLAITLSNLGNCLDHQGKYKEAQECHERALAIQEKAYDPNHPSLAITLGKLGRCLDHQGKHKEAQECHERALAIKEKAYDPNHPNLAVTLSNLGNCLDHQGEHKEAQNYHERALAIKEKAYDPNHPSLAITLSNLGNCLNDQGKYKEAQKYLERALAIKEKANDPNHPSLAVTLSNLGNCLNHQGKYKEALKCHERALAIQEKAYDPDHPYLAITLSNLGTCLDHQGKHKEAQKFYERALAIKEMRYDENNQTCGIESLEPGHRPLRRLASIWSSVKRVFSSRPQP